MTSNIFIIEFKTTYHFTSYVIVEWMGKLQCYIWSNCQSDLFEKKNKNDQGCEDVSDENLEETEICDPNDCAYNGQCIKDYNPNRPPHYTRVLSDIRINYLGTNTIQKCKTYCKNYTYASVAYKYECHCANDFAVEPEWLPDSSCNLPCHGNRAQTCGGGYKSNVYTV